MGRALSLVVRNLGGAREGLGDMATMGQPAKFSFCFAENERESPWEPLQVERGLEPDRSAVTVVGVAGLIEVFNGLSNDPLDTLQTMADAMATPTALHAGGTEHLGGGHPIAIISPEWAASLARAGMSKLDVKTDLWERARWPGAPQRKVAASPEDVIVVVAGGVGIKQTYVPNWSGGSAPVTVPVRAG
jgi:hypothetical protein